MQVGKWEKYRIFFFHTQARNISWKKEEKIFYGQARNKDVFALVEHDKK